MLTSNFVIRPIPVLTDNYVWILIQTQDAWIIDPGDAVPVAQFCHSHKLQPKAILLTHQHQDHWAGVAVLKQKFAVPVYGPRGMPAAIAPLIDFHLDPGTCVSMAQQPWQVVALPGHTAEHLGFYVPGHLFCGDTLFSFGCGRAFYSVDALFESIVWITQLPSDTLIYPTHEYTAANWRFAQAVEPANAKIAEFALKLAAIGPNNPSLPVCLGDEIERNPFLRYNKISVQKAAELASGSSFNCDRDVFSALRAWKNVF